MVVESLERELAELRVNVAESTLAGSALVLARMLDSDATADTARTAAARELREVMGALRAQAADRPVDRMVDFERRLAAR